MKRNDFFTAGVLALALIFGLMVAGCASAPTPEELPAEAGFKPVALGPHLEESLRKYEASEPRLETWGPEENRYDVNVYHFDPSRFEAFKAELNAGGEYKFLENWDENRDWETGKTFARLSVMPNGYFEMDICKEDNTRTIYRYKKVFEAGESGSAPKTIKITGFISQGTSGVPGLGLFSQLRRPGGEWIPPSADADAAPEINGQTFTYTLKKVVDRWWEKEWWDRAPFTEAGKFYIEIQYGPALKDKSKDGANYIYSADGKNPTAVDITDDVTAFEWSKFIWFDDFTAG